MLKKINDYLNTPVKDQVFEQGVEIYEKSAQNIDKQYDKKLKFLSGAKTKEQKQGAFGILIGALSYCQRRLGQIEASKPKKKNTKADISPEDPNTELKDKK